LCRKETEDHHESEAWMDKKYSFKGQFLPFLNKILNLSALKSLAGLPVGPQVFG